MCHDATMEQANGTDGDVWNTYNCESKRCKLIQSRQGKARQGRAEQNRAVQSTCWRYTDADTGGYLRLLCGLGALLVCCTYTCI